MDRWRGVSDRDRATQSPQRPSAVRVLVNALGWIVRTGAPWRLRPTDFSPWEALSEQQAPRWVHGGWFDAISNEWRSRVRTRQ